MSTTDEQLASNDSAPADQTSVSATTTSTAKTKKRPALRSPLWEDFIPIYILEGDPPVERRVGKCKQCGVIIQALGNQGTNGLKNHSESCKRKVKESHKQPALTYEPSGAEKGGKVVWVFDQEEVRLALVEMIILDELPFIFVEKVGFVRFMKRCCPMFDIPGRKTIRTDCVKIFLERKDSLKSFFNSKGSGTISITTDCWTSLRNHSFICLTAHFIGRNWQLHKKIINFKKITSHKGEDVADSIITCLDEWGIKRVLCCTLDNASANDVAIRHLRERLQLRVGNTLDGRFLHMRCVAHIINLVVQTGIEVIGISVRRVREACKWITASVPRTDRFKVAAESMLIKYTKELTLNMPTRWNATYIMLEHAEPYEEAFRCYEGMMPAFVADLNKLTHDGIVVGPPTSEDWTKVRWMMEYLKKFYDLTTLVSGTSYVTSHLFFKEMCDLLDFINNMADSDDEEIKSMAMRMKAKVAKYWSEEIEDNTRMNKLLYIAAVIDPRQKLRHVEKCLKHIYCSYRASELVLGVRVVLSELVEAYRHRLLPPRPPRDADVDASQGSNSGSASAKRQRVADALKRRSDRGSLSSLRSDSDDDEYTHMDELSLYLNEGTFKERKSAHQGDGNETDVVDKFDVLKWWSTYGLAYPILSEIARDVLAIPISTVASEAAFSTGGRIMESYRTYLHPNMLEAIVCTEDWLRSADSVPTVEELSEHEQEMLYMNVLKMIGLPSFNIMPLPPGSGSCSGGRGVAGGGGDIDTANGGGGVASGCGSGSAASSGV